MYKHSNVHPTLLASQPPGIEPEEILCGCWEPKPHSRLPQGNRSILGAPYLDIAACYDHVTHSPRDKKLSILLNCRP